MWHNSVFYQDYSNVGDEKRLGFWIYFKVGPLGFASRLDVEYKRKRGVCGDLRLRASAAPKYRVYLRWGEKGSCEGKDRRSVLDMLHLKCLLDLQMELWNHQFLVWGEDWAGDIIWDLSTNIMVKGKKKEKTWDPVESTSMMYEMEISALGGEEICLALLWRQDSESIRKRIEVWLGLNTKRSFQALRAY